MSEEQDASGIVVSLTEKKTGMSRNRSHQMVVFESFMGLINCDNIELLFVNNCELIVLLL